MHRRRPGRSHSYRETVLKECRGLVYQTRNKDKMIEIVIAGIILKKWSYIHIFTLTRWIHKILKLMQIKGFSMDDLKTFLPQMLKMFNFCIKKSLYGANLNITTVMGSSTFWVLCPLRGLEGRGNLIENCDEISSCFHTSLTHLNRKNIILMLKQWDGGTPWKTQKKS